MEINKDLELEQPELNDIDNESENPEHISEPHPPMTQAEPIEAKEFVLLELGDFKMQMGSCLVDSITLSNQILDIYNSIKEKPTKLNKDYIN